MEIEAVTDEKLREIALRHLHFLLHDRGSISAICADRSTLQRARETFRRLLLQTCPSLVKPYVSPLLNYNPKMDSIVLFIDASDTDFWDREDIPPIFVFEAIGVDNKQL